MRMRRDVRPPVVGGLCRRLTGLHGFGCGTFFEGYNLPLLRLRWKFERLDDVVRRLRRCIDSFCRVHVFAFRFEGTGLLSSPHRGEQSRSERNAPSLLAALAGGGATAMQCHDIFRGAKLPRSNQKRGQQASEHDINQRRTDEQSSHEDEAIFRGWMVPNGCRLNFLSACLYWFHHE